MIQIQFSAAMCALVICWAVFRLLSCRKQRRVDWKFELKQLLFLINLIVVLRFTFFPFSKVNGQIQPLIFDVATAWPFRINLVPFVNLFDYEIKSEMIINIIGNFAMFIPGGIMLPLIYKNINSFKRLFFTGFGISLAIEILQLPFAVRCSDIDDLILNTAGCAAGYGIYLLFKRKPRR